MAVASSKVGAQEAIIKPCDLCEGEEEVNWFCVDCIQKLCERCKKGHLKIVICRNHRLVPILEGVVIQKTNVSNLCKEHKEPFLFFCRNCKENICSICLSKVHKRHDFRDLCNFNSELQSSFENVIKEKENEQLTVVENIDYLEKCISQSRDTLTKNYAIIDDRMKAINQAVTEEGKKLKETLKTSTDQRINVVQGRKQKLEMIKNHYDKTIQTIRKELTIQTTSTFNEYVKTSTFKLQSLKPMAYSIINGTTFTVGDITIQDLIGKTEGHLEIRESHENGKRERSVFFSELPIDTKYELHVQSECYSICTNRDGSIWIGGKEVVYKMSSNCFTVLQQISLQRMCENIACLRSGGAIVSYFVEKQLNRITSCGERVEFKTQSEYYPVGIAVTNYDEVVVGFSEKMLSSMSFLVKYSKEGRQLKTIKMNTYVTGIYGFHGFYINKDGKYVISEGNHLTTLDENGTVLKKIEISNSCLYRMVCDRYGNVLGLPSKYGKSVYFISNDGREEKLFTVKCDNNINDICIGCDNRLLILVDKKKVIVAKY